MKIGRRYSSNRSERFRRLATLRALPLWLRAEDLKDQVERSSKQEARPERDRAGLICQSLGAGWTLVSFWNETDAERFNPRIGSGVPGIR